MSAAIGKAQSAGVGIAVVKHSAHFGAAGFYSLMAAKQGLVGMSCTSASGIQVAPTFGKQARLGTDPWSFAAPSADGVPFLLDMATTTVAAGRIRNKANGGCRRLTVGCSIRKANPPTTRWWRRRRAVF